LRIEVTRGSSGLSATAELLVTDLSIQEIAFTVSLSECHQITSQNLVKALSEVHRMAKTATIYSALMKTSSNKIKIHTGKCSFANHLCISMPKVTHNNGNTVCTLINWGIINGIGQLWQLCLS